MPVIYILKSFLQARELILQFVLGIFQPASPTFLTTCQLNCILEKKVMKNMTLGEFKANFSEALKKVLAGEEIGISYGKRKEIVARLVPKISAKKTKRKIGILEGKGKAVFSKDFSMTEEEFLSA